MREAEADAFICASEDVPPENTVTKAWRLIREFGDLPKLRVELVKRIPSQSGLGGGSSDAAGFLRAVNSFARHTFPAETLREVARAVGADVPYFLVGGCAKVEGYGEIVTPMPDPESMHLVIAQPSVTCLTKGAYAKLDEQRYPWREFPETLDEFYNDFERVMPCDCDDWSEHLQLLGALRAQLTGSGSAIFGEFGSEAEASRAKADLDTRRGIRSWVARTLSRAESLEYQWLSEDEFV